MFSLSRQSDILDWRLAPPPPTFHTCGEATSYRTAATASLQQLASSGRGALTCKSFETRIPVSSRHKSRVCRRPGRLHKPWATTGFRNIRVCCRNWELQMCEKSLGLSSSLNKMAATAVPLKGSTVVQVLVGPVFYHLEGAIYWSYWRYVIESDSIGSQGRFIGCYFSVLLARLAAGWTLPEASLFANLSLFLQKTLMVLPKAKSF